MRQTFASCLVLVGLLAACGGDDDSTDPAADTGADAGDDAGDDADGSVSVLDDDELAEVDDPLYDPFFDDPVDPNEPSLDGMKLYFDTNHPDASWRPQLGSFGISGGDRNVYSVGGANVEDFAIEICDALRGYAGTFGEANIEVSTYVPNEGGGVGDESLIATGTVADGCTAS